MVEVGIVNSSYDPRIDVDKLRLFVTLTYAKCRKMIFVLLQYVTPYKAIDIHYTFTPFE